MYAPTPHAQAANGGALRTSRSVAAGIGSGYDHTKCTCVPRQVSSPALDFNLSAAGSNSGSTSQGGVGSLPAGAPHLQSGHLAGTKPWT